MNNEIKDPELKFSVDFFPKMDLLKKVMVGTVSGIHASGDAAVVMSLCIDTFLSVLASTADDEKDFYSKVEFWIKNMKDPMVVGNVKKAFGSLKVVCSEYMKRN